MPNGLGFSGLHKALLGLGIRARKQSDQSLEISLSLFIQPVYSPATASVIVEMPAHAIQALAGACCQGTDFPMLFALSAEHTSEKVIVILSEDVAIGSEAMEARPC